MRLLLALVLNAGLLSWLLPWLGRQWRQATPPWRLALVVALLGRLLVGGLTGWEPKHDAAVMSTWAHLLTAHIWQQPAQAWVTFQGTSFIPGSSEVAYCETHRLLPRGWGLIPIDRQLVYYGVSNTLFFMKGLACLNLLSADSNLLNGLYLGLFSFVAGWQLLRTLARLFPAAPAGAALLALLLWPSVLYFTAGISKETGIFITGTLLLATGLQLLYEPGPNRRLVRNGLTFMVLAVLHFKLRYFFAVLLLGMLAGLALIRLAQGLGLARHRLAQITVVALALALGGSLVAAVDSPLFSANRFTSETIKIYTALLRTTQGRPHFEYPELRPTLSSLAAHAPRAVVNTLTRPWLGESAQPLYLAASLDNLGLLLLLALALLALGRGRGGHLPFAVVLTLVLFCLALAFLVGISTPNLGTMHRYRVGLLPYLLLLLLQNDYAGRALGRLGLRHGPA